MEFKESIEKRVITSFLIGEQRFIKLYLKKMLSNVYGELDRNKDNDSLFYTWEDSTVKLILIANLKDSYFAILYNIKK